MANSSSVKSGPPSATNASERILEAVGFGMLSHIPPRTLMFTSVSVIIAAPFAIFFTRSKIAALSDSFGALTKYSKDA